MYGEVYTTGQYDKRIKYFSLKQQKRFLEVEKTVLVSQVMAYNMFRLRTTITNFQLNKLANSFEMRHRWRKGGKINPLEKGWPSTLQAFAQSRVPRVQAPTNYTVN